MTHIRAKALRRPLSPPEARLWVRVRAHRLRGFKFRRQHPIGPYILDFYCPAGRLAVEIDGRCHDDEARLIHDRRRTEWLHRRGIRVIRIAAVDVRDELEGVLAYIGRVLEERLERPEPPPPPRFARSPSPSAMGR
ncbi:MAG: endonuclease domain-containing protein [Pseudomonadota bacterium]|nr:endonuclease domain-containing protein [Pseudomonadota bacterium]